MHSQERLLVIAVNIFVVDIKPNNCYSVIWRQIDTDSLTFHAAHIPVYLDLHKQLFYIEHKHH